MSICFKNSKTGEKVYIDADDFKSFKRYMNNKDWILVFE